MTTTPLEGSRVEVAARAASLNLLRVLQLRHALARAVVAVPAYPAFFAITFLLVKVGESWSPLQVVVRPLVVVLVALAGVQLLLGALAGRHVAGYFVSLVFLLLIEPAVAVLVLLLGIGPLAWRSVKARRLSGIAWPELTRPLNVISIVALAVTVGSGVMGGTFFIERPATALAAVGTAPADAPDIYLILLDGYPRSDLLHEEIGIDNTPFLADMRGLGFDVAARSHSNYGRTALTLASIFSARPVADLLPNPPASVPEQARALGRLINSGAELDVARAKGYEIVSIPSPVDYVSLFAADRVLQSPFATEFELTLTEQDLLRRIAPDARHWWFLDQHRQRILGTFQALAGMPAEPSPRPRLVFAHILAPHAPIAFGDAGEEVMLSGCEWTLCPEPLPLPAEFRADYAAQMRYLDGVVESTARAMLANTLRPSVIIFFSDHGSRLSGTFDSMFDNLILSYTPGKPGLLPTDATPVNLLPRLFNAYIGTNEPFAPEVQYRHPDGAFLPVMQVNQ